VKFRRHLTAVATGLLAVFSAPVLAAFAGYYAPGNWRITLNTNLGPNIDPWPGQPVGVVNTSGAPVFIRITSADGPDPDPGQVGEVCPNTVYDEETDTSIPIVGNCYLEYTIPAPNAGKVRFKWDYKTTDRGYNQVQGPAYDPFGYVLNGQFIQLSDDNLSYTQPQQGTVTFTVAAGDVFGFRLDCTDCRFGGATVVISDFSGPLPDPVPIPTISVWSMGILMLVLGLVARFSRRLGVWMTCRMVHPRAGPPQQIHRSTSP
jgi:hypothetical protein